MKNKNLIITILLLVIVAGGSFFAGVKYQQSRRLSLAGQLGPNQFNRQGSIQRNGNMQGNRSAGFRPVNGEISSIDEKSITVKGIDGGSKIVIIGDSTQINKAETVTKDQLKVGEKVAVFGTENSDGSLTAQNVQLNPIIRVMDGDSGK